MAPYMIGSGRATRSALDQSERDLNRRLISEAELVPCPSCNWINDDLVRGYRRGRYQRLTVIAFCISIFGTAGSLIAAGYMSIGPAADRKLLPYVLIGGPALFLTLAAAVVLVRVGLRSLIRPNRKFPEAPKLPRGTPPALLKDRSTGSLKPAKPDTAPHVRRATGKNSGSLTTTSPPFAATARAPRRKDRRINVPSASPVPSRSRAARSARGRLGEPTGGSPV